MQSLGGCEISAQVKVHLTPGDSTHDKLCVEHPQLGSQHVSDQVDVLLACDHQVVHPSSTVQLFHLFSGLSPSILNSENLRLYRKFKFSYKKIINILSTR